MEKDRWSPEEVAKAGSIGYIDGTVSAKTVYNYIHYHMKGELKKLALGMLRLKGRKRKTQKRVKNAVD